MHKALHSWRVAHYAALFNMQGLVRRLVCVGMCFRRLWTTHLFLLFGFRVGRVSQGRRVWSEPQQDEVNNYNKQLAVRVQPWVGSRVVWFWEKAKLWLGSHLKMDAPTICQSCADLTFFLCSPATTRIEINASGAALEPNVLMCNQ